MEQIQKVDVPQPGDIAAIGRGIVDEDKKILWAFVLAEQRQLLLKADGILGQVQLYAGAMDFEGLFARIAGRKTPKKRSKMGCWSTDRLQGRIGGQDVVKIAGRL